MIRVLLIYIVFLVGSFGISIWLGLYIRRVRTRGLFPELPECPHRNLGGQRRMWASKTGHERQCTDCGEWVWQ